MQRMALVMGFLAISSIQTAYANANVQGTEVDLKPTIANTVDGKTIQQPEAEIIKNDNGNLEITGEPNVEKLKKAVQKYEASQISKGNIKRTFMHSVYHPIQDRSDWTRRIRNYGPTCAGVIAPFIARLI